MGITTLFILENNLNFARSEDIIPYIAHKTQIPVYLDKQTERRGSYPNSERWDVDYYEEYGTPHVVFTLIQDRRYKESSIFFNEDYLDVTPDYVICGIELFEELTWYGILNVFLQEKREQDAHLVPAFKRMLASYKTFGALFYSKALLICPDTLFEIIRPFLRSPFQRNSFSSISLNFLSFESAIVKNSYSDDKYLYLENWA